MEQSDSSTIPPKLLNSLHIIVLVRRSKLLAYLLSVLTTGAAWWGIEEWPRRQRERGSECGHNVGADCSGKNLVPLEKLGD